MPVRRDPVIRSESVNVMSNAVILLILGLVYIALILKGD